MSDTAVAEMIRCMRENYGNPSSIHSAGQRASAALFDARERMASLLGCTPKELTFTSGGSEADNQALLTAARIGVKTAKRHIVSSAFEHHAVLNTLEKLEKEGFEITLINVGEDGIVRPEDVERAIRADTVLVSIMYANNEIGTIQEVERIGGICKDHGVLFHTDAVAAAGHVHIDVKKQNINMLSLSAHKFGGPKGIGTLYARRGIKPERLIEGGAQERGARPGTENLPAICAMAAAFEYSCRNMDENAKKEQKLRDALIIGLSHIPGAHLNGDADKRLPGNVNFSFDGVEGETLVLLLDGKGICASSGSACTSGSLEPSHVLLAIGRSPDAARASLRLSIGAENTEEEIEFTVKAVRECVEYLRGVSREKKY